MILKGVLLHGGFGTRLRPLTHTGPKQLLRVAGKPVSQWCIEDLRDSGIRRIGVVLGELSPERVVEYYGDGGWLGVEITYIYQGYPYGLAHAVFLAREFVGDEPFVVYLGDNILLEGIKGFVREFEESDADAMVLLTRVKNPQRFGVAKFDKDGRLIGLVEKPREPPSNFALVGIYMFRPPHIFRAIEGLRPSWRGELEITDAIQKLIDWGLKVDYRVVNGWWKDTGTPGDILDANRLLLDYKVKESRVEGEIVDSTIQGRVIIGRGARIENSVIRGPAFIGEGTIIRDSYIGPYTSIGNNCLLEGIEIEDSVILDEVRISGLRSRLTDSIIGSRSIITRRQGRPAGLKYIIGENTYIET